MDLIHIKQFSRRTMTLAFCMLSISAFAEGSFYTQHNLVSDGFVPADNTDPNLVNPWGIAFGTTNPVWIANNGTGTSTIYNGLGNPLSLVVKIPPSASNPNAIAAPTGIVFNNTSGWVISSNGKSAASAFIFSTEDGTISAWAPSVNLTNAIKVVDNSASGAVYKGLTRGADGVRTLLYAANFNSGNIDVFDNTFAAVTLPTGSFVDPYLPAGYAPHNVQNINGTIYVAYAKQDAAKHDSISGEGLGFVDAFDPTGKFLQRIASRGALNAPWGITLTPEGFGKFSNHLLIGNFGDGKINAYSYTSKIFHGQLHDSNHNTIIIDGLWGLAFGNGVDNQPTTTLYFTAGPAKETHGIYGNITPKV